MGLFQKFKNKLLGYNSSMTITDGDGNSKTTYYKGKTVPIPGYIHRARPWPPPPPSKRPLEADGWFQDGGGI